MKKCYILVMTLFICINGIQQSNAILDLSNLQAHKLFTKNVQFDQEFDEIPKVVLSIKQIIGEHYELYTRASNINLKGFDLQIISSSNIDNIKINYLAINDDQLSVVCENYQTKKDEIKVPINLEHQQVAAFITGLNLQKNENIYFKLNSITNQQVIFQTKQKAMGLCLVFGDENKIAKTQSMITTTQKDNLLEFNVENIEDSLKLPLENLILSFDDIVNKLSVETKEQEQQTQIQTEEEKYLEIDSIQIETLGINKLQQNIEDELIQSVDIEFVQPSQQVEADQLLKIEENHIQRVQDIISQSVDEQLQLEQLEEKKFLAQMNQVNVEDIQNIQNQIEQEIIIQEAYQVVPQTVDELDMDALYREFTLGQELNDDLNDYNKNMINQQQQKQQSQQQQQQEQQQQQQQQQQEQQQEQEQQQQQQQQQQQENLQVIESVDVVQEQLVSKIQSNIIDQTEMNPKKQINQQKQLQIDVPLFDEDLEFDDIDVELDQKKEEKETQASSASYIIDVYNAFANEEAEKLNSNENEKNPFVEVETEAQPEEMPDEMENELDGLRDGLEGVDFSLFFDEFSKPNEIIEKQPEQKLDEQQNKKIQKYEEPKQFKQPKEKIEDVMKVLQIKTEISTSEDEKILISQLKQKSAELKKKLQEQYDAVPKLEQAKKQTEVSIHSIEEQYPQIQSDSKIDYEVESKYTEWSMSQDQKIKKIGLDLTEDDLKNPRFSLLQMDQKSELDIQKQINEFLGFDDLSFVMIKQNLRGR